MWINLTSVFVDDQDRALRIYTEVSGSRRRQRSPSASTGSRWSRQRRQREFTQEPAQLGPVTTAVLDDTCGNLIQIAARA